MSKTKQILFFTSLVVCTLAYVYTLILAKFNHTTAIGAKQNIPNCRVIIGLEGPTYSNETIEIHTVDYGIKIVEAETQFGAMYGLGFSHAMDRLWQLEFMRRLASGRLSEVFGSETLQIDKHIRTIGIQRMTDKFMLEAPEADLLILENYAAGVNKVVEQIQAYPLEFYMFWTGFEPFTARDSVSLQFTLMYLISSDWFFEITRERLLEVYSKE